MGGKDFVSFLVDETFKLRQSGKIKLSSLELKMNDYGLTFFKGQYIPQLQIIRFYSPYGDLDIPKNWSVFSFKNNASDHCILDEDQDRDHFFSVVKNIWNKPIDKLLIIHSDGICYLVGLSKSDSCHIHDLVNPQKWLKTA